MFPEQKTQKNIFKITEDTDWLLSILKSHALAKFVDLEVLASEYNLDPETIQMLTEHFRERIDNLKNIPPVASAKDIIEQFLP